MIVLASVEVNILQHFIKLYMDSSIVILLVVHLSLLHLPAIEDTYTTRLHRKLQPPLITVN